MYPVLIFLIFFILTIHSHLIKIISVLSSMSCFDFLRAVPMHVSNYLGLLRYIYDRMLLPLWSDLVFQTVHTFCVMLVRLLCSTSSLLHILHCLSSLFLNESTIGAFTTYSGRKLHMFTVLFRKVPYVRKYLMEVLLSPNDGSGIELVTDSACQC